MAQVKRLAFSDKAKVTMTKKTTIMRLKLLTLWSPKKKTTPKKKLISTEHTTKERTVGDASNVDLNNTTATKINLFQLGQCVFLKTGKNTKKSQAMSSSSPPFGKHTALDYFFIPALEKHTTLSKDNVCTQGKKKDKEARPTLSCSLLLVTYTSLGNGGVNPAQNLHKPSNICTHCQCLGRPITCRFQPQFF